MIVFEATLLVLLVSTALTEMDAKQFPAAFLQPLRAVEERTEY